MAARFTIDWQLAGGRAHACAGEGPACVGGKMKEAYPGDSLERLQETQVEILKVVAAICDEFELTWFADSGTCLGAVRHGGFIPWDDDIDISMPIDDYRRFCEIAPQVLEGTAYGLYEPKTTEHYPPLFAKVYKRGTRFIGEQMMEAGFEEGIFIDVFAYGRLDSDERKAKRQADKLVFWQRMSYLYHIEHPYIAASTRFRNAAVAAAAAAHRIARVATNPASIVKRFEETLASGDGQGLWTNVFYADWGTYDHDVLFPVGQLQFGDMTVPVPHDTKAFLTTLYGDYMQVPPEEERFAKPPLVLDFGDGVNVLEEALS